METAQRTPASRWKPQVTLGDRLRVLRRDFGLINGTRYSQLAFARLLSVPGGTYAAWEANTIQPPYPVCERIAEITGVDPDWLAGTEEPPKARKQAKSGIRSTTSPTGKSVAHLTSRALRRRPDTSIAQKDLSAA